MRVLILAYPENSIKIKYFLKDYQYFFNNNESLFFDDFVQQEIDIRNYDKVIIDEYNFQKATVIYDSLNCVKNLFLWFYGALVSIDKPALIDVFQEKYYKAQKWDEVKRINKIKIEINRLKKSVVLDTYPSQLQLESTSFCNACCIMCSHYYAGNVGALDMSQPLMDKLKELFPYLEILIMHGNGEPFSSRYFDTCVETYSQYGISLTTNTNLSILTDNHIEKLNNSFVNIRVSCDACTKEIYEGIRKKLSFERFVANLEKLRDGCPALSKTMAVVAMRQNIRQIPEMVEFAAQYGFEEIIFSNLGTNLIVRNEMDNITHYPFFAAKQFRQAIKNGEKLHIKVTLPRAFDLSLDDALKCEEELIEIESRPYFKTDEEVHQIKEFAKSVAGDEFRVIEDLADCLWDEELHSCNGICEWCIEKPYIDLKGNVYVCCINASYRVGNVFEYNTFMDLWNNDVYKKIRRLFYSGKLPGFCDNCQFICNGSLKRLLVQEPDEAFYYRRHISRFYFDYCKEHNNGE